MASSKTTTKSSSSTTSTQSSSTSKSTSRNVLDEALLAQILGGLSGEMTRAEIEAYAKSLLMPQLNAGLEAARQTHETWRNKTAPTKRAWRTFRPRRARAAWAARATRWRR